MPASDDLRAREASLSCALATVFRGKLCDSLFQNRTPIIFDKDEIIYEVGDKELTFFFIRRGFLKVGTITEDGQEIIYDIRKEGDVVGELCAYESPRRDRTVALEPSEVIAVPYADIVGTLQKNPDLLRELVAVFSRSLAEAYEQVTTLAVDDTLHRLIKVLLNLADKLGRPAGTAVEIPTYLTQEELSQMVAARRERVSTALNLLRRRGMVQYSRGAHLLLDVNALKNYRA